MKQTDKAIKYTLSARRTAFERKEIRCSEDINAFMRPFWKSDIDIYESFFILLLSNSLEVIGYAKISQGGICSTVVDCKIIAKYAIDSLASHVAIAHNHPSGGLKPSIEDQKMTQKIKEVLNLFDCKLIDHLIITDNGYYSFADNGRL